ncbi:SDR family NAD(P)-dependent oxidoreductase [Streptomyces sp. NPDC006365]|uniref:SDR family NAD(P)-dependent oxidoreductase n=1 Tax=Streptomyces sp. NPDC006365 TaxID=3364744 RepID=UPI0036A9E631
MSGASVRLPMYVDLRPLPYGVAKCVGEKGERSFVLDGGGVLDQRMVHMLVGETAPGPYGERALDDPDADTAALDRMHATNHLGVIAVIRAASRVLRAGGRIITVSSGLGSRVGVPGAADYSATKSGIERYTMGVARDLGSRDITANVVEAGLMEGSMEGPAPEILKALVSSLSLQRMGHPEEIAAAIAFLASPPRRTSRARCWTPTVATTLEPGPLSRAPKDIAPSGRAPPMTRACVDGCHVRDSHARERGEPRPVRRRSTGGRRAAGTSRSATARAPRCTSSRLLPTSTTAPDP